MINYCAVMLLLFIPLISCSQNPQVASDNIPFPETFYVQTELIQDDSLRIHLPQTRPKNMSIMAPDGTWYTIQSEEDAIEQIPQTQFNQSNYIEFKISKLKGVTWKNGKKATENVFVKQGEYLIYFADNMETEPENTFHFSQVINFK